MDLGWTKDKGAVCSSTAVFFFFCLFYFLFIFICNFDSFGGCAVCLSPSSGIVQSLLPKQPWDAFSYLFYSLFPLILIRPSLSLFFSTILHSLPRLALPFSIEVHRSHTHTVVKFIRHLCGIGEGIEDGKFLYKKNFWNIPFRKFEKD